MAHAEEEIGGIRTANRAVPWWLVAFAVTVLSFATWYLLSFTSEGSAPAPGAPVTAENEAH